MRVLGIILALLGGFGLSAQNGLSLGVYGGVGSGNMQLTGVELPFLKTQSVTQYSFGIQASTSIYQGLSARAELQFNTGGFHITEGLTPELARIPIPLGASLRLSAQYVEVPLLLQYEVPLGPIQAYVHSGLSIDHLQTANLKTSARVLVEIPIYETDLTQSASIDRWSSSALIGGGVKIPTKQGAFTGQVRYQHGLGGQLDLPVDGIGVERRGTQFSLGYQWQF